MKEVMLAGCNQTFIVDMDMGTSKFKQSDFFVLRNEFMTHVHRGLKCERTMKCGDIIIAMTSCAWYSDDEQSQINSYVEINAHGFHIQEYNSVAKLEEFLENAGFIWYM